MRISVFDSAPLQGVILALKGAEREVAAQIRKATRQMVEPVWRQEIAQHTTGRMENRVLVDTARAAVTNQNVNLKAGHLSKRLSGGAPAYLVAPLVEFGADPTWKHEARSTRGRSYVRRMGSRFRPRNLKGYVAYPTAADVIPRIASLWVQTTVRTFYELVEKGAR